MTLFYDPKKRKVKPWVISTFLLIAIGIMLGSWVLIKVFSGKVGPPKTEEKPTVDIFKQF